MPHVPEMPAASAFDPAEWAQFGWSERQQAIRHWIAPLPLRALVAFAVRCAKRIEPLTRIQPLIAEAFAAGLDVGHLTRYCNRAATDAAHVPASAAYAAYAAYAALADADYAIPAVTVAARAANNPTDDNRDDDGNDRDDFTATDTARAAAADADKLRALNLGTHGEPGQPIRWSDARLGPLWPNGEPEWYGDVVRTLRELDDTLRSLPDPNAPPDDPLLVAQMDDWHWLDEQRNEGKLDRYRGEFVLAAAKRIFGHGRNLVAIRPLAEQDARAQGIDPERIIDYFMPGEQ